MIVPRQLHEDLSNSASIDLLTNLAYTSNFFDLAPKLSAHILESNIGIVEKFGHL